MRSAPAVTDDRLSKSFIVRRRRPGGLATRVRDFVSPRTQSVKAIDDLSFSIEPGERVAFIGPNGAGKSTTLKILAGILRPDTGNVRVLGLVPSRERRDLAFRIGTVFGQRSQLWYQLSPRDMFALLQRVYEIGAREHRRRLHELVTLFELGALLDTPVRHLSLGERMRCEIAASLLHAPHLLFLDEPTIGLDVSAKATIRELLRAESERDGLTLLLTSHDRAVLLYAVGLRSQASGFGDLLSGLVGAGFVERRAARRRRNHRQRGPLPRIGRRLLQPGILAREGRDAGETAVGPGDYVFALSGAAVRRDVSSVAANRSGVRLFRVGDRGVQPRIATLCIREPVRHVRLTLTRRH